MTVGFAVWGCTAPPVKDLAACIVTPTPGQAKSFEQFNAHYVLRPTRTSSTSEIFTFNAKVNLINFRVNYFVHRGWLSNYLCVVWWWTTKDDGSNITFILWINVTFNICIILLSMIFRFLFIVRYLHLRDKMISSKELNEMKISHRICPCKSPNELIITYLTLKRY